MGHGLRGRRPLSRSELFKDRKCGLRNPLNPTPHIDCGGSRYHGVSQLGLATSPQGSFQKAAPLPPVVGPSRSPPWLILGEGGKQQAGAIVHRPFCAVLSCVFLPPWGSGRGLGHQNLTFLGVKPTLCASAAGRGMSGPECGGGTTWVGGGGATMGGSLGSVDWWGWKEWWPRVRLGSIGPSWGWTYVRCSFSVGWR